jgi:hypothetical protein
MRRRVLALAGAGLLSQIGVGPAAAQAPKPAAPTAPGAAPAKPLIYDFTVTARIVPTERAAHVTLELGKGAANVKWIRFRIDPQRHLLFRGDGNVAAEGAHVTWTPPPSGGALRYVFRIDHLRDDRRYDARCAKTWAIYRGEDLVPTARVRSEDGARSRTACACACPVSHRDPVREAARRRLSRRASAPPLRPPDGLDDRRDARRAARRGLERARRARRTARRRRAPPGHARAPALDPAVAARGVRLAARSPADRAGRRPMCAAASGPGSPFLHSHAADQRGRHEPAPARGRARGVAPPPWRDGDWAIEGWPSTTAGDPRRSGTVSPEAGSRTSARERGAEAAHLRSKTAPAPALARGHRVRALDRRIREATVETRSLDDVVRLLVREGGVVTTARMQTISEQVSGQDLSGFFKSQVP